MAEYIRSDTLVEQGWVLQREIMGMGYAYTETKHINEIPTEDVQPVAHGRWKWSEGGQCSECGFHNSNFGYNYCPNCGARMDGEA